MTSRKSLVTSVVVIVLLAAVALYEGMQTGNKTHPIGNTSQRQVAVFPAVAGPAAQGADVVNRTATGSAPSGIAIAQPYPGGGPFEPGPPPFGQAGVAGDGLSAWGVAFKESSDPAAQPDANLIKSAYQDAQKKAETLASATSIRLGKLIAIGDYGQNQPYFNGCIQPEQPKGSAPSGGGSTAPGAPAPQVRPGQVETLPAPVSPDTAPALCQGKYYVVVWVLLRYQIGA
jgi:Protein of unknown function (DUF541)